MIVFPNSKINLGLRVFDKREDGFHNIETVLYPVRWCDALEVIPAGKFSFALEGLNIGGDKKENLCIKAYMQLHNKFKIPAVKMCLLKNVPAGAGLGGGSSDAAFTLMLLNEMFELNLSTSELKSIAAELGSDCAFFIENKPCFATGRGDQLQPVDVDFSSFFILIVFPGIHVSTPWAYEQLVRQPAQNPVISGKTNRIETIEKILKLPITSWQEKLINDFEEVIFNKHPEIPFIKQQLYHSGALYAAMSGSGSAVYGIFEHDPPGDLFTTYQCYRGRIGTVPA
ncbi:MAG: 4-(cytidine 5'-diphospho)-2-C-methyl-D-erythritol kinase [Chitinophagales bacterium]